MDTSATTSPAAPPLNVVLVSPEIPPNTGNIGRLCVAAGATLHLVKPLGFQLDDRSLARAGLDYWQHLNWHLWESIADLQAAVPSAPTTPGHRLPQFFYLTTKSTRPYWSQRFQPGDYLVFGRETKGLPASLLAQHPDQCLTIPMEPAARSLNLATSVGIVLYEAMRQNTAPPTA
jgi:tRNA (cytidine/uridine-2'-O-)-methyltransferase